MRAYLGPLAAPVRLPYACTVNVKAARDSTERVTLGGQVRMQTAKRQRRSWEVGIQALRPDELGELAELLEVGRPPWVWVDPWSQTTNLLTPRQSVLAAGTFTGAADLLGRVDLGHGVTSQWHIAPHGDIDIGAGTPVEHGTSVTGSAWVRGTRVRTSLVWTHADGRIEETKPVLSTGARGPRRVVASGRPTSSVRSVALRVRDAEIITRPAITWTPKVVQWHHGQGCASAVVLGMDQAIVLVSARQRAVRSADATFTVQEVGQ